MMHSRMDQKHKIIFFTISIVAIFVSVAMLFLNPSKDTYLNQKKIKVSISKNKSLPVGTSFMMDTTKKYLYKTTRNKIKLYDGKLQTWEFINESWAYGKYRHFFIENEKGLRDDQAEALLISYPVIVGKKWYIEDNEMIVVRIFDDMTTPAGTFQNVIEVSQSNEEQTEIAFRHYYAENVGLIRSETGDGKLLSELVKLQ
ncbi:MAG: hypothetical protein K0R71_2164 [Bacillales bacterium]|nr:hypothetical protein [Bacillales bacterium]